MSNQEVPYTIELLKVKTKEDAEYPQESRYKSGSIVAKGFMFPNTRPQLNKPFYVYWNKTQPFFHTSSVKNITEIDEKTIEIETVNSVFRIIITN